MDLQLSLAEKRLLLALPRDGSPVPVAEAATRAGFSQEVEAMVATGGPERHGLLAWEEMVKTIQDLTEEGRRARDEGLPEQRAIRAVNANGGSIPLVNLTAAAGLTEAEVPIAIGWMRKRKWGDIQKKPEGTLVVAGARPPPSGPSEEWLHALPHSPVGGGSPAALEELVARGLATWVQKKVRSLRLTAAGQNFVASLDPAALSGAEEVNQLTPDLIARWPAMTAEEKAKLHLRPFDVAVPVAARYPGKPHPLQQTVEEVRDIFVSLGFQEIAGGFVEPAFWNMDALFIPQDHPAREMQDTFYLKEPATLPVPKEFWAKVRDVQLTGAKTGSTGWGGRFTEEESRRALLRTHTTVTTLRHLAASPRPPCKVFGVGRVFRNEAMDATHLPEFHQIEGIVSEEGANLGMLIGILREFYTRLGFPEVQFRPSYYPYTEPSLDVAVKWGGRWLELGGAGVFRPEVTQPLGVPCPVLAWGLGLERLALMRLGLKDIRQLYLSDVQWLREQPLS